MFVKESTPRSGSTTQRETVYADVTKEYTLDDIQHLTARQLEKAHEVALHRLSTIHRQYVIRTKQSYSAK